MFMNVQIMDDKCLCTPTVMNKISHTVFYANFKRNLFKEIFNKEGSLKDDFPQWFRYKKSLNESDEYKEDPLRTLITYTNDGENIPITFWYNGERFKEDIKGV